MLDGEQMAQAAALLNEAEKVLCFGTISYAEQLQMDLFYVGKSSEVLHGFIVDTAQRISCKTLAIIFDPGYPWFTMQEQIKYFVSAEAKVILISSQKREELESLVDLVFHFPGTGTSMDEVFYYVFMSIFSMEYRKALHRFLVFLKRLGSARKGKPALAADVMLGLACTEPGRAVVLKSSTASLDDRN